MPEYKYETTMKKSDQLLGFSLYVRDWTLPEIAIELDRHQNTIRGWYNKYSWSQRKERELRDIEEEMRAQTQAARKKIIEIGTQTLDDVFIKDKDGKIIGVAISIEDVRDLKTMTETITKAGGIPEKIETKTKTETTISGDLSVKTEVVDPEIAAAVGRAIALKQSR